MQRARDEKDRLEDERVGRAREAVSTIFSIFLIETGTGMEERK